MDIESTLSGHNLAFLEALYEAYQQDPSSVDPQWLPVLRDLEGGGGAAPAALRVDSGEAEQLYLQSRVDKLIEHYRLQGHAAAAIDPLGRPRGSAARGLDPAYFDLGPEHMDREFDPAMLMPGRRASLRQILAKLQKTYCGSVGVEYWHLHDLEQRTWLQARMEANENRVVPAPAEQRRVLRQLAGVEDVDKFLHTKFLGAKRFSVAGAEAMIALLDCLIEESAELGVGEVCIGMAHRGRLAVLMSVMGKPFAEVFSEFEKSNDPQELLGAGDVKYHLGHYREYKTARGHDMYLALAFNPSHLEAITPVIAGRVRGKQDALGDREGRRVMGITLHGDAAFVGQGVVPETLNLSQLPGYRTGGSIRVVINNQVGFTTDPEESRSTPYATSIARMLDVPVFHVNGDDVEAVLWVARLAAGFRQRFGVDVIIDLVCYRRFGHNEADDPTFTQPVMYAEIKRHPSVRELYQRELLARGTLNRAEADAIDADWLREFEAALAEARGEGARKPRLRPMHGVWNAYRGGPDERTAEVPTALAAGELDALAARITRVPEGFQLHAKLPRLIGDLKDMYAGSAPLSWQAAELLAYASVLARGNRVRFSGQDVHRGTFSHRHAVYTDARTGAKWSPLAEIAEEQGRFEIFNSPLSEYGVLGFEFGYSICSPESLVIWEAQFGDFANGAQIIIDNFISASEDKWNRLSGLVLMLPHGYEGQGPEHSSARLERFLQLCAEDNIQVCNLTTPAQLFHALRRQVLRPWRKPLILMSPKSLLRARPSFSPRADFEAGAFHRVIDDPTADPARVTRVMLSAGKIYYDLADERELRKEGRVALIRVEQLYPFPAAQLAAALARYPGARERLWVQEEPHNYGAWTFVAPRLAELSGPAPRYVGRVPSASPATGSPDSHAYERRLMLEEAFAHLT